MQSIHRKYNMITHHEPNCDIIEVIEEIQDEDAMLQEKKDATKSRMDGILTMDYVNKGVASYERRMRTRVYKR